MEDKRERVVYTPTDPTGSPAACRQSRSPARRRAGSRVVNRSRSRLSRLSKGRLSRCASNQPVHPRRRSSRSRSRVTQRPCCPEASRRSERRSRSRVDHRASSRVDRRASSREDHLPSGREDRRASSRVDRRVECRASSRVDRQVDCPSSRVDRQVEGRASSRVDRRASSWVDRRASNREDRRASSREDRRASRREDRRASGREDHRASSREDRRASSREDHWASSREDHRAYSHHQALSQEQRRATGRHSSGPTGCRSRSPVRRPQSSAARDVQSTTQDKTKGEFTSILELSTISNLVNVLKSMSNNGADRLGSLSNTIPEFDPSKREQTMTMWLHKVNECATIYTWSEKQIIHFALPKLKGIAQRWYEGLPSVLFTWAEWQEKLLATFPSEENYGQMLSDMLAKRARFTDPLEEYYYDKLSLINRCGISGKRAVECILHGIDDRSVRLGAEAAQFDDPNKLLSYLRNARNIKFNSERKLAKGQPQKHQNSSNYRPTRCSNCKKDGHVTSQCTQPVKKCSRCNRIGHEVEQCYAKLPTTEEKKVMRIEDRINEGEIDSFKITTPVSEPNKKYFKTASVNGFSITAYVDFGSECSMIRLSTFRNIGLNYSVDNLPVLRGFGNSVVPCIGKKRVQIIIDNVEADLELLIVEDDAMHVALLIGQTFTEQPHVVIRKTSDALEISELEHQNIVPNSKIKLFCKESVEVLGLTIVDVYVDPPYQGDIFVDGSVRSLKGIRYSVAAGLFQIIERGLGQIVVSNTSPTPLLLPKGFLIARGRIAQEESSVQVLSITSTASGNSNPITEADLNLNDELSF